MFSELRSATRGLGRWRASAVAVLTLAAGIGTTTALYSVARVLLVDLPGVPALEQVGRLYAANETLGVERGRIALTEVDARLTSATAFQAMGAYADEDALVGTGAGARPVIAGYASPGFFAAMAVPPTAGRVFTAADITEAPVVVLGDALWRREFPDGRLAGATLMVDGVERAVVGVMPPEFHYPFAGVSADLWIPLLRPGRDMPSIVNVYARLRDGVEWPAAQAELSARSRGGAPWTLRAIPIAQDTHTRAVSAYAGTLGPAFLVLLIACVNVACLLMARGLERAHELSVRRALGAARWTIAKLLLLEHASLALASGALGAALAAGILRVAASQIAPYQPTVAAGLVPDLRLLAVALASSTCACLLFGTIPALRLSGRHPAAAPRGPIAGYGARDVIVFAEMACAIGFVVWTAMLYTFFSGFDAITPVFPADRIVATRVRAASAAAIAERVSAIPGVIRTAVSSGMIGGGSLERADADGGRAMVVSRVPVGDGFFDALDLPIVRGRTFDTADLHARTDVVVLGEGTAARLAGGGDPIGLRLRMTGRADVTVIGVCRDAMNYGLLTEVDATPGEMYVPYEPSVSSPEAVVIARFASDAHGALAAVAAAAEAPAGTRPPRPVVLADDFQKRGTGETLVVVRVLGGFAILTVLLAASGIFAVISQSIAQRSRELAVHIAIGATPGRVLRMVLAREAKLIAAAAATGVGFTVLVTHTLFVEMTRLSAVDPSIWMGALALSGGMAAIAVTSATLRIVRLDPASILRRP